SNGGGAYNLLKDLVAMQVGFPLEAAGLVGNDHWGQWIRHDCLTHGIDVQQLQMADDATTSYTDVMTLESNGKRTFFHHRGANALLDCAHFHLTKSRARIFHLAYILLLDRLDHEPTDGGSKAALLLQEASEAGFITSADLVSVHDNRFTRLVLAALPWVDYLFLNEFEAEKITGISISHNGAVSIVRAMEACEWLLQQGLRKWVLLHFPEGAIALSANGEWLFQGSVLLPHQHIAGTVGAGDAFAAGVLASVHEHKSMQEALQLGVCAAAACLTHATCSGGVMPIASCVKLGNDFGFRSITVDH
ncbi:MAG TPA: carbohydrate kinase family protein, partial [Phnomibacter sp.]|nr:carbohydrate kinase family protein [Phnomibacter sp.]